MATPVSQPSQPNQRERAAAEARTKILAAAADCIVREGLAQVRMAKVAKTAGVSSGLVHYHFETKERLFSDVLDYSCRRSTDLTGHAIERADDDPAARLSAFLDRCLPSDDRATRDWLLWQELALLCMRDAALSRVATTLYDDLYETGARLIREGTEAGVLDPPSRDFAMLSEAAVALCDGLGTRVLSAGPDLTLAAARETVETTVGLLVGHDGPLPALGAATRTRASA